MSRDRDFRDAPSHGAVGSVVSSYHRDLTHDLSDGYNSLYQAHLPNFTQFAPYNIPQQYYQGGTQSFSGCQPITDDQSEQTGSLDWTAIQTSEGHTERPTHGYFSTSADLSYYTVDPYQQANSSYQPSAEPYPVSHLEGGGGFDMDPYNSQVVQQHNQGQCQSNGYNLQQQPGDFCSSADLGYASNCPTRPVPNEALWGTIHGQQRALPSFTNHQIGQQGTAGDNESAFDNSRVRYAHGRRVVLRSPPPLTQRNQEAAARYAGLNAPQHSQYQQRHRQSGAPCFVTAQAVLPQQSGQEGPARGGQHPRQILPARGQAHREQRERVNRQSIPERAEEWTKTDSDTATIGDDEDDRGRPSDDGPQDDNSRGGQGGQNRRSFFTRLLRGVRGSHTGRRNTGSLEDPFVNFCQAGGGSTIDTNSGLDHLANMRKRPGHAHWMLPPPRDGHNDNDDPVTKDDLFLAMSPSRRREVHRYNHYTGLGLPPPCPLDIEKLLIETSESVQLNRQSRLRHNMEFAWYCQNRAYYANMLAGGGQLMHAGAASGHLSTDSTTEPMELTPRWVGAPHLSAPIRGQAKTDDHDMNEFLNQDDDTPRG